MKEKEGDGEEEEKKKKHVDAKRKRRRVRILTTTIYMRFQVARDLPGNFSIFDILVFVATGGLPIFESQHFHCGTVHERISSCAKISTRRCTLAAITDALRIFRR